MFVIPQHTDRKHLNLQIKIPPKIDRDIPFAERLVTVLQKLESPKALSVDDPDIKQIVSFHKTFLKVAFTKSSNKKHSTAMIFQLLDDDEDYYTQKFKHKMYSEKISIKELQSLYFYIPWLDMINGVTSPAYNFSSDDQVIFHANGYVHKLHAILGGRDKRFDNKQMQYLSNYHTFCIFRTILNYYIWRIVEDLMPFVDEEVRKEWQTDSAVDKASRNRFCSTFVKTMYVIQLSVYL